MGLASSASAISEPDANRRVPMASPEVEARSNDMIPILLLTRFAPLGEGGEQMHLVYTKPGAFGAGLC
jgi:hypothetical protein